MGFCDSVIDKHCDMIAELYNEIHKCKDITVLNKMYSYLRKNATDFYDNGSINNLYYNAVMNLMDSELLFNKEYLLDNKFYLDVNDNISINHDSNEDDILKYLVYNARLSLIKDEYFGTDISKLDKNIWDFNLVNYCELASEKIKELCDQIGVSCKTLIIYPGFDKKVKLFDGIGYHYFNIIDFGTSKYLIDVTYSQFFNKSACNIGRIGIMDYSTPRAGYFMMLDDKRKNISKKLLSNGYIKLSDDGFKDYMDGFTLSFRNGLYYQKNNDYSFTTSYTSDDYFKFLNGLDSQVKHEGIEVLGFQKKPLAKRIF